MQTPEVKDRNLGMRTDTGQVFRLEDYRPSDYLIPETRLDFRLSPDSTVVVADLVVERRADTAPGTPLVLQGDGLTLKRLEIDGRPADAGAYAHAPDRLTIERPPAERFRLTVETEIAPAANLALMGLYRSERRLLHAVRGGGLSPHHLFPRPARRALGLHGAHRGRPRRGAASAVQRQSARGGELPGGRHFAVWHDPFRNRPTCSPWSRAISAQ
jgi:aminopeptidase N